LPFSEPKVRDCGKAPHFYKSMVVFEDKIAAKLKALLIDNWEFFIFSKNIKAKRWNIHLTNSLKKFSEKSTNKRFSVALEFLLNN
jgi:hypothetical protein